MKYDLRLRLVQFADSHGVKPAARKFGCQPRIARKWLRRWREGNKTRQSLQDRSRAPRTCPHKTPAAIEAQIVKARQQAPCHGPRHLRDGFHLPASQGVIARVLRQQGLTRPRKKTYQTKRDLRAVKAGYRPFQENQADTKYLTDIPYYVAQLLDKPGLPRFEYTFRDVRTGGVFLGFAKELSEAHASCFVAAVGAHLARCGFPLAGRCAVQTDNGSEFSGAERSRPKDRGFRHVVQHTLGATHRFIPPGKKNHQADVESFHHFVETEFFDLEAFRSPAEFFDKSSAWLLWWNTARLNYHKGGRTPDDILRAACPGRDPRVWLLPALDVDDLLARRVAYKENRNQRGYHVPALPAKCGKQDKINILIHEFAHNCGMPDEKNWPSSGAPGFWKNAGIPGTGPGGEYQCSSK